MTEVRYLTYFHCLSYPLLPKDSFLFASKNPTLRVVVVVVEPKIIFLILVSSALLFHTSMAADSDSNLRIMVERNPPESRLAEMNIKCWPKWGCSPGKYQLKFDAEETCYLLKGKVKAYPKGSSQFVEFGAGDLVTIPKGLSCTWDVSLAVDKYYKFESSSS